jgi:DNA-binding MarR family transcriptional regulator
MCCTCGSWHNKPSLRGKHPRTRNGFLDASNDLQVVTGWWLRWPDANIGIVTGAVNGCWVFDVDPRHGGVESLADFEREHEPVGGRVHRTGGGGQHRLFAMPVDGLGIGNRTNVLPGLDVRGDGGYILAPPSKHGTGGVYSGPPQWSDLRPAPAALVDLVRGRAVKEGSPRGSGGGTSAPVVEVAGWRAALLAGPACWRTTGCLTKYLGRVADDSRSRHDVTRDGVLALLRLGSDNHTGVGEALDTLRTAFVESVMDMPDRHAEAEWARMLAAAVRLPAAQPYGLCACRSLAYRWLIEVGGTTLVTPSEQRVLRYLQYRADLRGSRLVSESQRQISEATLLSASHVAELVARLEGQGWFRRRQWTGQHRTDEYVLTEPDQLLTNCCTTPPNPAEQLVARGMSNKVHPLFGPDGLGPQVEATFALLPEWSTPLGRFQAVRVTPGSRQAAEARGDYQETSRRVPRPRRGRGRTRGELRELTGCSRPTLNRHLARLAAFGLAFQDGGRWYRYRFDPDWRAAENGVPDTAARLRDRHAQERAAYDTALATLGPDDPRRRGHLLAGGTRVDTWTGELIDEPGAPAAHHDGLGPSAECRGLPPTAAWSGRREHGERPPRPGRQRGGGRRQRGRPHRGQPHGR